ncbi:hypothetical protein KY285_024974 [Solanum tuberosum]|nr:hypothetical protein KY289_026108 [Solanum tuberosum]KAH0673856.1 hypothetical protein KY284_024943 [Solanum tuberosum]KAH0677173.1 hypothetical protein KY285_024974 [Solanum tuberosum]
MLEEIRVKMMKTIGDLREFSNSWIIDLSPMSLKILQENIEKSMQCNLTWNGERGFEIKHCGFTHTVDIVSRSCRCRSCQLRGIPYRDGVAALHYKELKPINYVASCDSKETSLITYAHFIQPMNNMKMWLTSINPIVKPPKIKKMPGRQSKVRRKEANESRKSGKLSKSSVVMTCKPMNNVKMWPTSINPIVKPPKIKKMHGRQIKVRRNEAIESRKTGKLSKNGVVMTCTNVVHKDTCPTRNQEGPSQSA